MSYLGIIKVCRHSQSIIDIEKSAIKAKNTNQRH